MLVTRARHVFTAAGQDFGSGSTVDRGWSDYTEMGIKSKYYKSLLG
jgi:hypothetical protein